MNLRQFVKFWLFRDTTFRGEYRAIRDALPPDAPKIVIDVGANDGFYGSNSYPFIARGWRAVLVEPDPRAFEPLSRRFNGHPHVECRQAACGARKGILPLHLGQDSSHSSLGIGSDPKASAIGPQSGETVDVSVEPLADILDAAGIPARYGVLSIDTEGHDLNVLIGAGLERRRPDVIFTETYAPDEAAKRSLLEQVGYRLRAEVDTNTLWTADSRR